MLVDVTVLVPKIQGSTETRQTALIAAGAAVRLSNRRTGRVFREAIAKGLNGSNGITGETVASDDGTGTFKSTLSRFD